MISVKAFIERGNDGTLIVTLRLSKGTGEILFFFFVGFCVGVFKKILPL